jgi:hypothetical protein
MTADLSFHVIFSLFFFLVTHNKKDILLLHLNKDLPQPVFGGIQPGSLYSSD